MTQHRDELAARPSGYLIGVIESTFACDQAVEDLAKIGLGADRVLTYVGPAGAEQLAVAERRGSAPHRRGPWLPH
jgi:hypothetical protein